MRKTLFSKLPLLLFFFILPGCSYRADRYDEHVVTLQSDQFNLYRYLRLEVLDGLNRSGDSAGNPETTERKMLSGDLIRTGNGRDAYSIVAVLSKENPPLVHLYREQCGKKEREFLFPVPLDRKNAILLREGTDGTKTFQILLSLRYDTLFPIVRKNNYELFILTLRHTKADGKWEIVEFREVTEGGKDAVQGVFHPDGLKIAFVEDDRRNSSVLVIMNRDGTDRKIVSEHGILPCFLSSGELIFVEQSGLFRDFRIYSPRDGSLRKASDAEISQVLRTIPASGLREFYLRFGLENDEETPTVSAKSPETLRELFEYGLRNSPLVLQSYYEYLAVKARNTQNLFDIGPDFFMGADYLLTSNIFFETPDDPYYVIGDRIGNDNFIRLMTGFSVPVIPNLPLRWAKRYYDDWREEYCKASILKSINEFSGRLSRLVFDFRQAKAEIDGLNRQLRRNEKRLERFRTQLNAGCGTRERVIFAENIRAGLESDRNAALEKLIQTQLELAALTGWNPEREIHLEGDDETPERLETLHGLRGREWFFAQGRINRQEPRQIDALIQQDAATRDMGPERTRIDAVRVSISYGVGFIDWRRLVDDFLLMGVSYAVPMRLPVFFESYYQDYESRIMALRMRKYQIAGAVQGQISSAWSDYSTENGRAAHREIRGETLREQARLAGLRQRFGIKEPEGSERDSDEYASELESIAETTLGLSVKYERLRRLSLLYEAAGRADVFLRDTVAVMESGSPLPSGSGTERKTVEVRGVYLWIAPDLILSKAARDEFFENCGRNGIRRVFCYFSMKSDKIPFLKKYEPEYAFFLEGCRRAKIRVLGLIGEPAWLNPEERGDLAILLDSYLAFNREREERGEKGFDGLSFDVEPHSEPDWNGEARNRLIADYLNLLEEVGEKIGRRNLDAAVPYSYSGVSVPGSRKDLLASVAERCGGLTLMTYRDTAERVVKKAEPVLARKDLRIPVFVALETNRVDDPEVSFYGTDRKNFLGVLQSCAKTFSKYPTFSGMVIHDYSGFKQMR